MDAEYQIYLKKERAGSPSLHKLHAAATNATKVQVHIIPDLGGVQEQIIPLSDEEVATIRDIFPRLKDLPPLSREAWENRKNGNYPYMSVCWVSFDKLEFLDAEGNVLADMFLNTGIAEEERWERSCLSSSSSRLTTCFPQPTGSASMPFRLSKSNLRIPAT